MTIFLDINLPLSLIGGYPFSSIYSMSAPRLFKASTKIKIGLSFIRAEPVNILEEFRIDE